MDTLKTVAAFIVVVGVPFIPFILLVMLIWPTDGATDGATEGTSAPLPCDYVITLPEAWVNGAVIAIERDCATTRFQLVEVVQE